MTMSHFLITAEKFSGRGLSFYTLQNTQGSQRKRKQDEMSNDGDFQNNARQLDNSVSSTEPAYINEHEGYKKYSSELTSKVD